MSKSSSKSSFKWFACEPAKILLLDDVLSAEEFGALWLLRLRSWIEEPCGTLPADNSLLSKWSRLPAERWKLLSDSILKKFKLTRGRYICPEMVDAHARCRDSYSDRVRGAEATNGKRKKMNKVAESVVAQSSLSERSAKEKDGLDGRTEEKEVEDYIREAPHLRLERASSNSTSSMNQMQPTPRTQSSGETRHPVVPRRDGLQKIQPQSLPGTIRPDVVNKVGETMKAVMERVTGHQCEPPDEDIVRAVVFSAKGANCADICSHFTSLRPNSIVSYGFFKAVAAEMSAKRQSGNQGGSSNHAKAV